MPLPLPLLDAEGEGDSDGVAVGVTEALAEANAEPEAVTVEEPLVEGVVGVVPCAEAGGENVASDLLCMRMAAAEPTM